MTAFRSFGRNSAEYIKTFEQLRFFAIFSKFSRTSQSEKIEKPSPERSGTPKHATGMGRIDGDGHISGTGTGKSRPIGLPAGGAADFHPKKTERARPSYARLFILYGGGPFVWVRLI